MSGGAVLVLGGGSDIGLAIARRFARAGHAVQLAARRPDALEDDRADIALRHGVAVGLHAFDARDLGAMAALIAALPELPHIVVSVVGWLGDQDATAGDGALAAQAVETNFLGPAWALEVAARALAGLDAETCVIGVSSVAGDRGRATNYWYGASKAGFTAFLSGLRQKYARTRLHVVTVKPGFVATRMTASMDLPARLTARPDEVGEAVFRAWRRKRNIIYVRRIWLAVMAVIRLLPEPLFKRTRF